MGRKEGEIEGRKWSKGPQLGIKPGSVQSGLSLNAQYTVRQRGTPHSVYCIDTTDRSV